MKERYVCQRGDCAPAKRHDIPKGSIHVNTMDGTAIPGCVFCEAWWLIENIKTDGSLSAHEDADELMFFFGCSEDDKNDLCGEIVFQIENDVFTVSKTCMFFIPRGAAHGLLEVRNIRGGILCSTSLHETDTYSFVPAKASAPKGAFAKNLITGYNRPHDSIGDNIPPGFDPTLWIDCRVFENAPYLEVLRFNPVDFSAPEAHTHTFDEIIAFMGSHPDSCDSLNGEIRYAVKGEDVVMRTSTYFFLPAGTSHSPITVKKLDRYVIHFSGGGRGIYELK